MSELTDQEIALNYMKAKEEYLRWCDLYENTSAVRRAKRQGNRMMAVALVIGGVVGILLARWIMGFILVTP
jgi:hypothetical protein